MSSQEALQCGFVSKVFPAESFAQLCQKHIVEYSKIPLEVTGSRIKIIFETF